VTDEVTKSVYCIVVDVALAKQQQRPVADEATESEVDSDDDDSMSLDSSPFASPQQPRAQALITSASAFELASLANDDSSGQFILILIEQYATLIVCINILTSLHFLEVFMLMTWSFL